MNIVAKLLPRFLSELGPRGQQIMLYAFVAVGVLMVLDYRFAAESGIPFVSTHVVTGAMLAWFAGLSSTVHLSSGQNVDIAKLEAKVQAEAAKIAGVADSVMPVVDAVVAKVDPAAEPIVKEVETVIEGTPQALTDATAPSPEPAASPVA